MNLLKISTLILLGWAGGSLLQIAHASGRGMMAGQMMDGHAMGGWAMGVWLALGLLAVVALVLAIVALVKYLRGGRNT